MIGAQSPNSRTDFAAEPLFYGTGKNTSSSLYIATIQGTEVKHHRKGSWRANIRHGIDNSYTVTKIEVFH